MKNAADVLQDGAKTFEERNAIYGDNFRVVPAVMQSLFPSGLTLVTYEDWMRLQFLMMDIGKTTRYTAQFYQGGHADSIHDKMVYAAMLGAVDEELRDYNARAGEGGDKGKP